MVPEPKELIFSGKWLDFDGFRNFPKTIMKEFNLKNGSWEHKHREEKEQTIKIYGKTVETTGDKNIALASIIQLIMNRKRYLPELEIKERVDFTFRGFHLDVARGGILTVNNFKKLMNFLFLMKYNKFGVYLEDLYPWKSFPEIGKDRGRLTEKEWNEIQEHGNMLGIDVFPSLELLGHMEHFLRMDEYREFGEMWWTERDDCIDAGNPKARKFTNDLLKDALLTTKSDIIHIGGDETWSLGRGRSLDRTGNFQGPNLYLDHYHELVDLVRSSNKIPMLWGDMLTGMYLTKEGKKFWSKVVEDRIWDNVIIANWDYEPEPVEHFVKRIQEIGHKDYQIACPALDNWGTFYPDFEPAIQNVLSFLKAAKQEKLQGYMITAWGDMGQECLFSYLNPLILASADIFSSQEKWEEKFAIFYNEDLESSKARFDAGKMRSGPMIRNIIYKRLPHLSHRRETRTGWQEAMIEFVNKYHKEKLSEDMQLIYSFMEVCISCENGVFDETSFSKLIQQYEELWVKERKFEGLPNVLSRLCGAGEVEKLLSTMK